MNNIENQNKSYWVDTESFNKIKDIHVVNNHITYRKKKSFPAWIILLILGIGGYFGYKYITEQKVLITNENEKTTNYLGTWKYEGQVKGKDTLYLIYDLLLIISENGECSLNGSAKVRHTDNSGGSTMLVNQKGKCYTNFFHNKFIMEIEKSDGHTFYEKWTDFKYNNNSLKIGESEYKK